MTPAEIRDAPAPAKLNLFLHVTGRRADGYHELETAFQLIDLQDRVHLRRRDDGQITRLNPLPDVPPEQDLTVRAARLLLGMTLTCLVTAGSMLINDYHDHKLGVDNAKVNAADEP